MVQVRVDSGPIKKARAQKAERDQYSIIFETQQIGSSWTSIAVATVGLSL